MTTSGSSFTGRKLTVNPDKLAEGIASMYVFNVMSRGGTMENIETIAKRCNKIARWFCSDEAKISLILSGGVGSGKTTLLKAIKATLWGMSVYDTKYVDATSLAERMKENQYEFSREICGGKWCRFLLIDDVGTEAVTSYKYKEEYNPFIEVVNERYKGLLPTIFTTNLSFEADNPDNTFAQRYGERTADRMREMFNIMNFKDSSYRK